jgi:hypothetical protein
VNPGLVVNVYAGEITSRQLGRKLGLDARAGLLFDRIAIGRDYCHEETAVPASA